MSAERTRRQIERLLDEAEDAAGRSGWQLELTRAQQVLDFDPDNADGQAFKAAAERALGADAAPADDAMATIESAPIQPAEPEIVSCENERYLVKELLGEGATKKVHLAHDTMLDRDVAFAPIRAEGLDEVGRQRILREAQAMARLEDHPNVV